MAKTKQSTEKSDNRLLGGTQKHFAGSTTLQFGGGTHAVTDVTGALQKRIAAATARTAASTAFHAAVQAENAVLAQTDPLIGDYETFVRATFGNDIGVLGDFGLAPRKARVVTPKVKAQAADRALETRKLRGTKGKKQRLAIQAPPAGTAPAAQAQTPTATPTANPATPTTPPPPTPTTGTPSTPTATPKA
jgi:hypothetical protein